jgi:5-methylcytosine-specific restriction endonuclease McrA
MSRSKPEWIGRDDDATPPQACKLRVFERQCGICALTGIKLMAGDVDYDHITPLQDGGENRESNLQAVSRKAHRAKTAQENADRAKSNRIKAKHMSMSKPAKHPLPGSKASGWKRTVDGRIIRRE